MKDIHARLDVLNQQHRLLDDKIQIMYKRYASDSEVESLKLKKLRIKEDITKLEKELDNA